jgi:sulfur carrier protein ThiS
MFRIKIWMKCLIGELDYKEMKVSVNFHTTLRDEIMLGAEHSIQVEIVVGWTVKKLLQELSINIDPEFIIILINGQIENENTILTEGDKLDFVPAIAGG